MKERHLVLKLVKGVFKKGESIGFEGALMPGWDKAIHSARLSQGNTMAVGKLSYSWSASVEDCIIMLKINIKHLRKR